MAGRREVFIVGLDAPNRRLLERADVTGEMAFHAALELREMRDVEPLDMAQLIATADARLRAHGRAPDAVVAFFDFPATDIAPMLARRHGLPSPSLESVLKCEHKYWSRIEQKRVIPNHIPAFRAFDPFDDGAFAQIGLVPPFWIKPIKSFRSFLAFRINDEGDFREAIDTTRQHIHAMDDPFRYLLATQDMPEEIAQMKGSCIAESLLSGAQCTLEGYVFQGEVVSYGIVDSVQEADRSSFARYEYPSSLPAQAQAEMKRLAAEVVRSIGLDNACFNIEFFYNQTEGRCYLLEINPRISQAHGEIFEKVHGLPHHRILLDVALGRRPQALPRDGSFAVAANFMLRTFEPGRVRSVPSAAAIERLRSEMPDAGVQLRVRQGQHLNELRGQDSYSFELATIVLGGRDRTELLAKYDRCLEVLTFEIEPDPPASEAITHILER